jgi:hypothetical protein
MPRVAQGLAHHLPPKGSLSRRLDGAELGGEEAGNLIEQIDVALLAHVIGLIFREACSRRMPRLRQQFAARKSDISLSD